jgi:hypothetical protein
MICTVALDLSPKQCGSVLGGTHAEAVPAGCGSQGIALTLSVISH